jgi:GNAT superfamily N-acetyltransferase
MTSVERVLPLHEWPRLAGTPADVVWQELDPLKTVIVVVEDEGRIVAHHILTFVLHAEALWVHPDYRHGRVGVQLWQAVKRAIRAIGVRGFMTAAVDDHVRRLIAHVGGQQVPGDHWVVKVEE